MLQQFQLTITQVLSNPKARIVFILGTIVLAALAGGAPSDAGGH